VYNLLIMLNIKEIKPVSILFMVLAFLLPIAVFPGVYNFSPALKIAILATVAVVSVVIMMINFLHSGSIELPKTKLLWLMLLIPASFLISAFFSGNLNQSIFGTSFEVGTVGSMLILYVIFLVSSIVGSKGYLSTKVMIGSIVAMAVCILHALMITLMAYGALPVINNFPLYLAGNYLDLSVLLGLSIILSLSALNFGELSSRVKITLWIFNVIAILFMGAVGFKASVIILGIFSLLLFVYILSISRNQPSDDSMGMSQTSWIKKSYSSVFVLLASLVIVISGSSFSSFLSNMLKISSFDVRPGLQSTLDIVQNQYQHNAITGAGPNKFAELWAFYKPMDINVSDFWATDFSYGYGFVPSVAATVGILGVLSILAFLFFYIKSGFATFFMPLSGNTRFMPVASFLASLFLWITFFLYNPGIVVLSFGFIWSGFFIASLANLGLIQQFKVNIFSNPKANFVSVFLVVVVMMGAVSTLYFSWEKIAASFLFNKAIVNLDQDGDISKARISILEAAQIYPSSTYLRSLAELDLLNIERIIAAVPEGSQIQESAVGELQASIGSSVDFAKRAIATDPNGYQNHMTLGRIYESLAQKSIEGAGPNAVAAYVEAERLNPFNPAIQLGLARVASFSSNLEAAKKYANKSIELKANYTDGYFILAQLEAASNNVPGTVRALESATLIDPTNSGLYFQLGLLKYQTSDFVGSAVAFERSVAIVPDYANAHYFLGLSYYRLGRKTEAVAQFEGLKVTNPDNAEIDLILSNLKANKDPFTGAEPPIDNKPEDRNEPPL